MWLRQLCDHNILHSHKSTRHFIICYYYYYLCAYAISCVLLLWIPNQNRVNTIQFIFMSGKKPHLHDNFDIDKLSLVPLCVVHNSCVLWVLINDKNNNICCHSTLAGLLNWVPTNGQQASCKRSRCNLHADDKRKKKMKKKRKINKRNHFNVNEQ